MKKWADALKQYEFSKNLMQTSMEGENPLIDKINQAMVKVKFNARNVIKKNKVVGFATVEGSPSPRSKALNSKQ